MIKTLQKILKQDREMFAIPKGVQQTIPVNCIWPDGIFRIGGKFSKSYRFEDINYAVASREDKTCLWLNENKTTCCKSRIGAALAMDNDLLRRVKAQAYQAGILNSEEMGPPAARTIDELFKKFPELVYHAKDIPQRILQN